MIHRHFRHWRRARSNHRPKPGHTPPPATHSVRPPDDDTFTVAVIPDTQDYPCREPHLFAAATRWIAHHAATQNIAFVTHVGDVVGTPVAEHYDDARRCLEPIHGSLPYGLCPGNRDIIPPDGDTSAYARAFGQRAFSRFPWYIDAAFGGICSAQTFTAMNQRYLALHLPCNATDPMLDWANTVLAAHTDRTALVTTHMYLGPVDKLPDKSRWRESPLGVMRWRKCFGDAGNCPQRLWERCFQHHANVRLIFCGDQSRVQAMHLTQHREGMPPVHSLMSDYRAGAIRLVRITPRTGHVEVITFSPFLRQLIHSTEQAPALHLHQFSFRLSDEIRSDPEPRGQWAKAQANGQQ